MVFPGGGAVSYGRGTPEQESGTALQKSRDALEESEARAADALRFGEREKVTLNFEILIPETMIPEFEYQQYCPSSEQRYPKR